VSLWQIDWAKPIVPAARSEYTVILIEMLLTVAQFPLVTLRLNHVPEERAEGEKEESVAPEIFVQVELLGELCHW
jgi:hypothetical protein